MRPNYTGGLTSPAVSSYGGSTLRSQSYSPMPMSPPRGEGSYRAGGQAGNGGGLLPADWPRNGGLRTESAMTCEESVVNRLQRERGALELKLHQAETREQCLVNQMQRERQQYQQVNSLLLEALRTVRDGVPDELLSPARAAMFLEEMQNDAQNTSDDRDLATAAAEAATKKLDELTLVLREKDATIEALQTANHDHVDLLEAEVLRLQHGTTRLLHHVRSVRQTSAHTYDSEDSLIDWARNAPHSGQGGVSPRRDRPAFNGSPRQATEWPPSPRRSGATISVVTTHDFHDGNPQDTTLEGTENPSEEWPPSPARHRQPEPGAKAKKPAGHLGKPEWPPSPQRHRSGTGDEPAEEKKVAKKAKEWPPSPQRHRTADADRAPATDAEEWLPSPKGDRVASAAAAASDGDSAPASGKGRAAANGKEWPPSPRRERLPAGQAKHEHGGDKARISEVARHVHAKAAGPPSARKSEWPASPRRTPPPVDHGPPQPADQKEEGYEVGAKLYTPDSIDRQSDDTAPKTPIDTDADTLPPHKLDWGAVSPTRHRDDSEADRNACSTSIGASSGRRRSVGFIEPDEGRKAERTESGASLRALDLIREPDMTPFVAKNRIASLERQLREARGQVVLDEALEARARKAFDAIDSLIQRDGTISKSGLCRALREEKLGAKVLFHELDANDNGEIHIGEWLHWLGRLQKRESAENMIEWIEERLESSKSVKEVGFASPNPKEEDNVARFNRVLDAIGETTHANKDSLQNLLRDTDGLLDELDTVSAESSDVGINEWLRWVAGKDELTAWIDQRLALSEGGQVVQLKRENEKLRDEVDSIEANFEPVEDHEYQGNLTEDHKTRAVSCFHAIDSKCDNNGVIAKSELFRVLKQEPLAAKVLFKELHEVAEGDITMAEWVEWFDKLEHSHQSAENMLAWIETMIKGSA
ncbi:hypothetical protein DIPPA_12329 [Diplonema papillatum]|nr:hypothetical protein DIPPA_12329 [Diplonema papillatum]